MLQGWWWSRMVVEMTGDRCHRRRKMMGRGAEGGCGTEEKSCLASRVSTSGSLTKKPLNLEKITPVVFELDFYTQARKALCQRSPFDSEDAQVPSVPTLPSGLANFLWKHSDRKLKKLHSGADAKSKRPERARESNIWIETEDYFRELAVEDIDRLYEVSSLGYSASDKCYSMPSLGTGLQDNNLCSGDIPESRNYLNGDGVGPDCGMIVEEEAKDEAGHAKTSELPREEKDSTSFQSGTSCSSLAWLLGSRNKIYLTSERPSKKRKLLGGYAGLEKLLVASPVDGSSSSCHSCSRGDMGDQLNRLIVCSSCGVAVHQRCYGVQEDEDCSWLCSWCKRKSEVQVTDRSCLLCPKQGGALKPVQKGGFGSESGCPMEFAHLFCCQWIPEVYVEDTRTMEPIRNVEGIKDTRTKLVCNLCKVKCGACVRCSNGACRTSFHPICAREARQRMEIWGKFGCDDVELRAFCSKHSDVQNNDATQEVGALSTAVGSDSDITKHHSVETIVHRSNKLRIARKNGDRIAVLVDSSTDLAKLGDEGRERGSANNRINLPLQPERGEVQQPINVNTSERNSNEDTSTCERRNYILILKTLIDREKVNLKEVASDIGVSSDSLASMLTDDQPLTALHCKIVKWLRNHNHIGTLQKNLDANNSTIISEPEMGVASVTDSITLPESISDIPNVVSVKSVPPRRRTKSNIRILKNSQVLRSSKRTLDDDGCVTDVVRSGQLSTGEYPSEDAVSESNEKILGKDGVEDDMAGNCHNSEGDLLKSSNQLKGYGPEEVSISEQNAPVNSDLRNPISSVDMSPIPVVCEAETSLSSYVHPLIYNQLTQMQNRAVSNDTSYGYDGSRDGDVSPSEASSSSGICCIHRSPNSTSPDLISDFEKGDVEQLVKARKKGILQLSPADEVEGELLYYQYRLLQNAVARKHLSDDLICKIVKSLPREIDFLGKQKWDAVLVNQYLHELRELKKQGRKERRHIEAQAVLAAATAAAAASSRISSFRKDSLDESGQQENLLKVDSSSGRVGIQFQQMPRAKDTLSRVAVSRVSKDKNSDMPTSDFSKGHPRTCDICRRTETILNPILVCSSCKVAVHLDCYRSVKESTGPWYCELCDDSLSSGSSGALAINSLEKSHFATECGLCGGTTGAFRKSTDGQWIHAFCAEWVLESTFRRGQINPIEGMEAVSRGSDVCHICHSQTGTCIKCNYGHCQSTFHPLCARTAGFYMNVRTVGGKLQHKAYCGKHSAEQKAKAETQKHGAEELKSLKHVRVELERLRLLCERIIKREKLKRELVLCSHEILASNQESVALSVLSQSSLFQPGVSSESATTSLKGGYMDGYKSGSEAIQRSDDITVDSTVAGKRRIRFPSMDNDQKTDDSSSSQPLFNQKPSARASLAGKQIPQRSSSLSSRNLSEDGERRSKHRKHTETFEKELVMTSDQASMKNQRLPKGFVYVPVRRLSKDKETPTPETGPLKRDDG